MSLKVAPLFFNSVAKRQLFTDVSNPRQVTRATLPIFRKFGSLPKQASSLPSANKDHVFADLSLAFRSFDSGLHAASKGLSWMQGGGFVGFTTVAYTGAGAVGVYDSIRQHRRALKIGDQEGAHLAGLKAAENAFLTGGAMAMTPVRVLTCAQDIHRVAVHTTQALSTGVYAAQAIFSWIGTAFYMLHYVINGIRSGWGLVQWIQGSSWRKELLASQDPKALLEKQLQQRLQKLGLKAEDYKKLALDAGAEWLKTVEQEAKKEGIQLHFKDRHAAFEKYIERHPEVITHLIGEPPFRLTGKGQLIFFGKYLAIRNESAKFEAECARKLGSKTVEALKTNDVAKIKEALQFKEWKMLALKVVLAVIGFAAVAMAAVFTGGIGVGVALALYGLGALISIYLEDWSALKTHLANGELRSKDRAFIYFTTILSLAAVVGLITLTVLSGGTTLYLAALILTTGWLIINLRAFVILKKNDLRPWDMQKTPTMESLHKLLKTQPTPEKIKATIARMSEEDQGYLRSLDPENILESLEEYEEAMRRMHAQARQQLIVDLQQANSPEILNQLD